MCRNIVIVTSIGVVLSVAACGGDEDQADTTRPRQATTTTDAPTFGTGETTTPGSGGFIETPQAKVDEAAREAPDNFDGEERQTYGLAKAVCARLPKRVARPNLTLFADALAQRNKERRAAMRRAAMEGCRAGLK